MKVNVIFHSLYGHVFRMAEAVAEGARGVEGAQVKLLQVRETLPDAYRQAALNWINKL